VPDPYYGGIDGFEMVYEVIDRSVQGYLMFWRIKPRLNMGEYESMIKA